MFWNYWNTAVWNYKTNESGTVSVSSEYGSSTTVSAHPGQSFWVSTRSNIFCSYSAVPSRLRISIFFFQSVNNYILIFTFFFLIIKPNKIKPSKSAWKKKSKKWIVFWIPNENFIKFLFLEYSYTKYVTSFDTVVIL